ncbi:MAG: energy-coupling factor ABC transporter ATP-binding protein [Thermoplasmatota archaeon]
MIGVKNLFFKYLGSDKYALKKINLDFKKDKITALMGENGSGKTTLLRLLAGFLKPTKGTVQKDEQEIGFSPEDPELGFFAEDVRSEVEFYPKNLDLDYKNKTKQTLLRMGITHLKKELPNNLSSGEQRLVSLASVLSGDPDVLILDEPTHSMHRKGEERIGSVLRNIDETIIFSTHSSEFALKYADELVVMHEGSVLAEGKPKNILTKEHLLNKAGIRLPGIVQWAKEKNLKTIPDSMEEAYSIAEKRGELG